MGARGEKLSIDIYPKLNNTTYYVLSGHKIRKNYGYWHIILLLCMPGYAPFLRGGEKSTTYRRLNLWHVMWLWKLRA